MILVRPRYVRIETDFWAVVVVGTLLAVALVGSGIYAVGQAHAARRARQDACAARLQAFKERNTFIRHYLESVDKCLALAELTGGSR